MTTRPATWRHRHPGALAGAIAALGLVAAACTVEADVEVRSAEPISPAPPAVVDEARPPADEDTAPGDEQPDDRPGPDQPGDDDSGDDDSGGGDSGGGRGDDELGDGSIPFVPDAEAAGADPIEATILTPVELATVAEVGPAKQPRPYDPFVAAALADVEEWLAETHPQVYGEPWEPLGGGVWPSYPGRTDIPGCGEPSTDPADVAEFVAFYCAGVDFMAYDDGPGSLLAELAAEFGPSVLGVVLAHEYGHVVQDRLDAFDRQLPTIITEQQADCFAGAWAGRAAGGGSRYLVLGDADVRGALITMVAVRDPVGVDQFEPGGHGSAFDRIGAFQEGYLQGPARCAELLDAPLPVMPNQFRTTADLLNDGDLPFGYGEGEIVPLIVDTLNSFWSFQLDALDAATFGAMSLVPVESPDQIGCSVAPRVVAPGLATCAPDRTVYLHDAFARRLYRDPIVGRADFAVGYLVALGWADVAQQTLDSELTGTERALANDCLVGAWTRDLDPDRPDRPGEVDRGVISPGDLDEAVVAALELGDPDAGTERLGVPFDKIDAFRSGVLGQIDACIPRLDP